MAIYMQIDGIEGSVTAKGFEKWIELTSFQFGVARSVSMTPGNQANRSHGRPSVGEISVAKHMEQSSSGLLQEVLRGDTGKKVTIKIVEIANDKLKEYVTYELEDTLVSSYSVSTGGDVPSESISLAFAKITTSFAATDKTNKGNQQARVVYDLTTAVAG